MFLFFLSPCHNPKPAIFTWKWGGSPAACLICSRPRVFFTNCSHISFSFPLLLQRKTIRKPQMWGPQYTLASRLRSPSQFISLTVSASARIHWNRCLLILTACCSPQSVGWQVTNAHTPMRTHGHTHTHTHIDVAVAVKHVCLTYWLFK